MGTLSRKAWQRAVNALLWYPDNLVERVSLTEELLNGNREGEGTGGGSGSILKDPTAAAAIRLAGNKRLRTLEQEIEAVEMAVAQLQPEQKEVIRRRFWESGRRAGRRKPRQYDFLQDLGYSIDGMRWIVKQVIVRVATYLGEK